jgi:hypothetical protein
MATCVAMFGELARAVPTAPGENSHHGFTAEIAKSPAADIDARRTGRRHKLQRVETAIDVAPNSFGACTITGQLPVQGYLLHLPAPRRSASQADALKGIGPSGATTGPSNPVGTPLAKLVGKHERKAKA